jgi:ureidoacrylate peracid hydrolase
MVVRMAAVRGRQPTRLHAGVQLGAAQPTLNDAGRPAFSAAILEALTPGRPGHALWHGLDVQPQDLCAPKNRYSAFFPGACAIPERLRDKGVDTVLITGTLTNVCCEASARDSMMAGFKTVMVSDANAARSDAEHLAALVTLAQFFADVRSTDEVLAMLAGGAAQA